jgi:NAD(P)-dependent dehydrogenase (short-subunit alcohol dehydrogenase family)
LTLARIVVNDVWGGDPLSRWGVPFWEHSLADGLRLHRQAVDTHLITSWYAAPLLVARRAGLIVEVTDGVEPAYRGSLFYDLAKASVIRLALAQAEDLRPHGVTTVALTPGFLRSEALLDHFGVTEATWPEAIAQDPHFRMSETRLHRPRGRGPGRRCGRCPMEWSSTLDVAAGARVRLRRCRRQPP